MARIPLPNRGQPLDTNYVYQIAETLNQLSEEGSALAQGKNFFFLRDSIERSSKIYGAQIYAGVKELYSGTATAGQVVTTTFDFKPGFAYPPVVQATVENTGGTTSVSDVAITIQDVSTTSVKVSVKLITAGAANARVHLTAIGLPTS
jgi:hypothetical protein